MNGILKRKLLYVKVRFISPLNVSSGENEWTDSDVLRDYEGNPFVAGSSLAGAMRAYICAVWGGEISYFPRRMA